MVCFFRYRFAGCFRKKIVVVLALSWLLGIFLGIYWAHSADILSGEQLHIFLDSRGSVSSLLAVLLLPVLYTVFTVYIDNQWLLVPFSFLKAISYSYIGTLLFRAVESGGWLLRFLYLFSDCFTVLILCWLWLRCCDLRKSSSYISCVAAGSLILLIGLIDYHFVSPFLLGLSL